MNSVNGELSIASRDFRMEMKSSLVVNGLHCRMIL